MTLQSIISFFETYGMFIYNTLTIMLSLIALYQLYIAQPKRNKYRKLLEEIIQTLQDLEKLCTELWCNERLLTRKKYIVDIKNQFRHISTNLTIIESKYKGKVKNLMDFVTIYNNIKDKATGGNFEGANFQIDTDRAEEISGMIANFSKTLKML